MNGSKLHLILMAFWTAFTVPTVLWWHDSVLLVLVLSLYALVASHWGAYQAAHGEERLCRRLAKLLKETREMNQNRQEGGD